MNMAQVTVCKTRESRTTMECVKKLPALRIYAALLCALLAAPAFTAQPADGIYARADLREKPFSLGKIHAATAQNTIVGSFTGLVILIDFPDQQADIAVAEVDSFLNGANYTGYGDNGSIAGYYRYVSQGRLNLKLMNSPRYYRAKYTYSYYDSLGHCDDLLLEALTWIDTLHGIDLSKVSIYPDSTIKSLNFFYAGAVHSVGAHGLWGHGSSYGYNFKNYHGLHTGPYCIAELGVQMHLGGLCHEMGHQLCGFQDLYDTRGASNGCGMYCLMAYGNAGGPNPIPVNPYFRYAAGWNDMPDLYGTPGGSVITLTTDTLTTWCYRNPDKPGEMFIVEARDNLGHNVNCPGQGILIWHVDSIVCPPGGGNDAETRPQHTADQHYMLSVVQADGKFDLESNNYYGHDADFFKAGGSLDHFTSSTNPVNSWWDGSASGFDLTAMSGLGRTMSFTMGQANTFRVHASSTVGGTVAPKGTFYVAAGGSKAFSVNLTNGFAVDSCLVNNVYAGTQSSYTFSTISKNGDLKFIVIRNSDNLATAVHGLHYRSYTGDNALFEGNIPLYDSMKFSDSGTVSALSLDKRPRDQYFGMRFSGWLRVPADGMWNFGLNSDDGSRFSIGGLTIVNYDGQHGAGGPVQGGIRLRAGYHPYVLDYINGQAGFDLNLTLSGPGVSLHPVSEDDFYIGTLQPALCSYALPVQPVFRMRMSGCRIVLNHIEAGTSVSVVSPAGRRIATIRFLFAKEEDVMDMSGMAEGVYIWRAVSKNGQIIRQELVRLVR
jgi:M6 family metalloprotease-like protein